MRISVFFFLTKLPGLIAKATLFAYVYASLCFYLQLRVFLFKIPFFTPPAYLHMKGQTNLFCGSLAA